jgi:hypothetical protein
VPVATECAFAPKTPTVKAYVPSAKTQRIRRRYAAHRRSGIRPVVFHKIRFKRPSVGEDGRPVINLQSFLHRSEIDKTPIVAPKTKKTKPKTNDIGLARHATSIQEVDGLSDGPDGLLLSPSTVQLYPQKRNETVSPPPL